MPTVLITPMFLREREGVHLEILARADCEVRYPDRPGTLTEEEIRAQIRGVDAVIASPEPYTEAVLAEARPDRVDAAHRGP